MSFNALATVAITESPPNKNASNIISVMLTFATSVVESFCFNMGQLLVSVLKTDKLYCCQSNEVSKQAGLNNSYEVVLNIVNHDDELTVNGRNMRYFQIMEHLVLLQSM